jgi:hypothetical protein
VHAQKMVLKFLAWLVQDKNKYKVSAFRIEFLFLLSFTLIGRIFSSVLSEQFSGSQMAFQTTFGGTGGYRKARTCFLKPNS